MSNDIDILSFLLFICLTGDRKQGFGRSLAGRKRGYRQRSKESESEKDERTVMPSFFSDEEGDETPPTSSQSESVKDRYSLSPFKSKSFPRKKSKSSTPKLQQMTLDLGQKMRIECQKCGMSYDRTDTKDVQMHTRHHTAMMQGMEWCLRNPKQKGRLIGQHTLPKSSIDVYLAEQDIGSRKSCKEDNEVQLWAFAVESGQQDPSTMAVLQDVQNIMDSALGSVPIELHSSEQRMDDKRRCQKKLIVAIWRDRVVGSALVGELPKSADVYRISSEMEKAVIINANDKAGLDNVPLAVHRIYVISILRRSGIASAILDAALDDCVYGMHKQEVIRTIGQGTKANTAAFSQPTESGRLLAQRWIQEEGGKNNGVLVFEEA